MEVILGLVAAIASLVAYIFYQKSVESAINSELGNEKAKNQLGKIIVLKDAQKEKANAAEEEYDEFRAAIMHEFDNDDDDGGGPAA